jgi:hypothetical protein
MRSTTWIVFCLFLLGCEKDPVSKVSTNNPDVAVYLMFEHDGIKVYRFYDNGTLIYYTDARGKTEWKHSDGKASSHLSGVETVTDGQ